MSGAELLGVAVLGMIAGMDLVSFPQAQLSRPLVAGTLGGCAVGAPGAGLVVGALLELFALETLPIGATRYPDWGPGAVAAGALAGAGEQATMPAGLLGVVLVAAVSAWVGGWLMHVARRANAADLRSREAELASGDPRALGALQAAGLLRDAARSLALTSFTIVAGDRVTTAFANAWRAPDAIAIAVVAATSGGVALWACWRLLGHDRSIRFFAGGLVAGCLAVALWLR
jgi:mannose/fructose/N-acetylgalactosamine-specific phosphotransferase system component IIC